jgi:hypothetical protein
MPTYNYPEDGKLHTRFSELKRCTPGSIDAVIRDRVYPEAKFEGSDSMMRGNLRHEEFNNEILITSRIPSCFGFEEDLEVLGAEKEIVNEIFPNIVLHSTPDCYGKGWVGDFKTVTVKYDEEGNILRDRKGIYKFTKPPMIQTSVYAIQLALEGNPIDRSFYFYEMWGRDANIVDYHIHDAQVTGEDIDGAYDWLRERSNMLVSKLSEYNLL